jgi:hypothetical protein
VADLAGLQGKGGLFEGLDHLPPTEATQIAARFTGWPFGMRFGQLGKIAPGRDLSVHRLSTRTRGLDSCRIGILVDLEQDMPGFDGMRCLEFIDMLIVINRDIIV